MSRYLQVPYDEIADKIRDLNTDGEEVVAVHLVAGRYDVFTRTKHDA